MNSINERIASLRTSMRTAGIAAYIVPTADPHMSEYLPEHWQARSWLSGFDGSAGTLIVTLECSCLWVDGRYFIQADRQTAASEVQPRHSGVQGVPTYTEFLEQAIGKGQIVGFSGALLSEAAVRTLSATLEKNGALVKDIDLIAPLWEERPPMPATQVFVHDLRYTGYTCAEKLAMVREKLKENGADTTVVGRLDCVAWLTNLRASDIEYNPFAVAYAVVYPERAELFINAARMTRPVVEYLYESGVAVHPYEEIDAKLAELDEKCTILCDPDGTNSALYRVMSKNENIKLLDAPDVITALKCVKNDTEVKNIVQAHVKDGCALVRFKVALEEKMAAGEAVTEYTVCEMLREERALEDACVGESFGTIAAYRENAAMMHYSPAPWACSALENEGFLLVDSGAQYLDGTTDITRTFVMGPLSDIEKLHYTYVLQSHIALARAVFMEGCTGGNVDILAREPIWKHGLDYRCGTGHGVGFLGGVHEGPQNLRINNSTEFREGMTITDEPGIYTEGEYGIRTENELLVVQKMETEYGRFLGFEPITFFPIDTEAIVISELSAEERAWLNDYHATVCEKLSPCLTGKHLGWLRAHTQPV